MSARVKSWLLHVALPAFVGALLVAPRCFAPITETDAGWHLALGRAILQSGIPRTNLFTWTFPSFPWYPTSWLFDVACWLALHAGGVLGLQLLIFLLVAGTLLLLACACRIVHPHGGWATLVTALLLLPRISERPHVATWLVLAAVLALCLAARERGWLWRAAALPVLVLGSNLHSGSVFPVSVFGLFCLESLVRERRYGREIALGVLGLLTMAANPGGLFNAHYLIQNFQVPDILRVGEVESPTLKRAPTFFGTAVLALLAAWSARKKQPVLLPMIVLFFAFGCYALRFVYDFSIVVAPTLAAGLPFLEARSRRLEGGVIALCLCALAAGRERYLSTIHFGSTFDATTLPVGAARFIEENHLGSHGFCGFRDGGYLEYADPDVPTFQDGRVQAFPNAFFPDELKAEATAESFQHWLRAQGVEWALASRVKEQIDGWHRLRGPDWALVYWDDASEVYVRRDVPRFAELMKSEYQVFRPDIPPAQITRWPENRLPILAIETARAFQSHMSASEAALDGCIALQRLKRPEADEACASAVATMTPEQIQLLSELMQKHLIER